MMHPEDPVDQARAILRAQVEDAGSPETRAIAAAAVALDGRLRDALAVLAALTKPRMVAPQPGQPGPQEGRDGVPWGRIAFAYREIVSGAADGTGPTGAGRVGDGWRVADATGEGPTMIVITITPEELPNA